MIPCISLLRCFLLAMFNSKKFTHLTNIPSRTIPINSFDDLVQFCHYTKQFDFNVFLSIAVWKLLFHENFPQQLKIFVWTFQICFSKEVSYIERIFKYWILNHTSKAISRVAEIVLKTTYSTEVFPPEYFLKMISIWGHKEHLRFSTISGTINWIPRKTYRSSSIVFCQKGNTNIPLINRNVMNLPQWKNIH